MTDRNKMYSAILHREVDVNGLKIKYVASKLGLTYNRAYKLKNAYKSEFDDYDALSLDRIERLRIKATEVMEKSRARAKRIIEKRKLDSKIDTAFHMPISKQELREFNAIAELVRRDEYLPIGYRKPKTPAPIVENIQNYVTRS